MDLAGNLVVWSPMRPSACNNACRGPLALVAFIGRFGSGEECLRLYHLMLGGDAPGIGRAIGKRNNLSRHGSRHASEKGQDKSETMTREALGSRGRAKGFLGLVLGSSFWGERGRRLCKGDNVRLAAGVMKGNWQGGAG